MSRFAVILPAAGKSSRFAGQKKKVFQELKGRPVWVRAAEHFVNRDDVAQTILVIAPEDREYFVEKFQPQLAFMDIQLVDGGSERFESVRNGLAAVHDDVQFVAIHDAARPLLVKAWIDQVFAAAIRHGAAILATPVTSTLKKVESREVITNTIPRHDLWEAQTPQVFRHDMLLDAFAKLGKTSPTDESQLVENAGHQVHVTLGSGMNLKITTQEDFRIAEAMLGVLPAEKSLRSLHPFADEDPRFL